MQIDKKNLQLIVITILLGAVGSGFWEYILKPITLSGTNIFLEIATLGMVSFKNSLYVEIAQGNLKEPSSAFVQLSVSVVLGILLGGLFSLLGQSTKEQLNQQTELIEKELADKRMIEQVNHLQEQLNPLKDQLNQLKEQLKEQLNQLEKTRRRVLVMGGLLLLFLITFSLVYSSRVVYVNGAITHFNQLFAISSPYLTPDERLKQISLFAQVRNRDDYFKIVTALSTVCEQNKLKVPEFSVW